MRLDAQISGATSVLSPDLASFKDPGYKNSAERAEEDAAGEQPEEQEETVGEKTPRD